MNYRDKVFNYFMYSSEVISDKGKYRTNIAGKVSRSTIVLWLGFSLFFLFLSFFTGPFILTYFVADILSAAGTSMMINIAVFVLAIVLVLIKNRIVFKKLEPKQTNINIYARELPSKLRPAHMRILVNDGLVDELSLISTIVDLIDRGYLDISKGDKKNLLNDKNMKLIRTNKPDDDLLRYEEFIIEWFIKQYGNGIEVSVEQVNQGLISKSGNMNACEMFAEWQALLLMSFPINKYFKKNDYNKAKITYFVFFFLGLISIIPFVSPFLGIYGFGCLLLASPTYVLNKAGVDEISDWLNLKKFLIDFGNMEDKTTEMVEIWDFYLTYSIALDVSSEATEEIESFFGTNLCYGLMSMSSAEDNKANADIKNVKDISKVKNAFKEYKANMELQNKQLEQEIEAELKKL